MYIKYTDAKEAHLPELQVNCPFCSTLGSFRPLGYSFGTGDRIFSLQYCPSAACRGIVIFVADSKSKAIVNTYPGLGWPINTEGVPASITVTFREAVDCYANKCYVAAAIMLRKTLEVICRENGLVSGTLYKKLEQLSTKIVIPQDLKEGMHDLRLLGNDAAHVEGETYNDIGKVELAVSIEFTQELIKALYQYKGLVDRLKELKKTSTSLPPATPE